ncbi:MAG: DUF3365 domain-containing protein [Magnetococcales bacterium]|nr:DUF3365 domain-containing protein [Magnetococcales bacterium]
MKRIIYPSLAILLASYVLIFFLVKLVIERQAMDNIVRQARAITVQAESARAYASAMVGDKMFDPALLEEAQKYIRRSKAETHEEIIKAARQTRFYRSIPIVAGWTIGQGIAHDALYNFRVVRIDARNPKNEATPLEKSMLEKMDNENLYEHWIIDEEENVLRYMRPVVMKKECLYCHGTEKDYPDGGGYDVLGIKMEGWALGEQRGAFEIISDLKPVQEAVREVQMDLITIGAFMTVIMAFVTAFWTLMGRKE